MEESSAAHPVGTPEVIARPPRPRPSLVTSAVVPAQLSGRAMLRQLAPLGVVFAELAIAPLYSLRAATTGTHAISPSAASVVGLVSLVLWSLALVVGLKYGVFILRAENRGHGGVLALMARVSPIVGKVAPHRANAALAMLGLAGAALLGAAGMFTPALAVLSAAEGLAVISPRLQPAVIPLGGALLVVLFLLQRRGVGTISRLFGPVMAAWFVLLGATGLGVVIRQPQVLTALDPRRALSFLVSDGGAAVLVLAAVVLCVAGAEALFSRLSQLPQPARERRRLVRLALAVGLPLLMLHYLGQGARLLENPAAAAHPFFATIPAVLRLPALLLAVAAALVAGHSAIQGVYVLAHEAMQLGHAPRMAVVHPSSDAASADPASFHLPAVSWLWFLAGLALLVGLGDSSRLGMAVALSVSAAMVITSLLFCAGAREGWAWGPLETGALLGLFLVLEVAFLGGSLSRVADGGWLALALAAGLLLLMHTWKAGRALLADRMAASTMPLKVFLADVERSRPHRVPGTAVFLTATRRGTPNVLLHSFKHHKVLHDKILVLTIVTDDVPHVPSRQRVHFREFAPHFWAVVAHYGFLQTPRIAELMPLLRGAGLDVRDEQCSFFLGRETLVPDRQKRFAGWRRRLFVLMSRNSCPPGDFFSLPPNRVCELGTQIEI